MPAGATSKFGYFPTYSSANEGGLAPAGYSPGYNKAVVKAGATTLTTTEILNGLILLDPNGAGVNLTTPTAAAIIAAMSGASVGSSFVVHVRNTADAAEAITFVGGTGVTVSGTATIAQNNAKSFLFVVVQSAVGAEAITAYSMGTAVF